MSGDQPQANADHQAAVNVQMEGVVETLIMHIKAAEARIASEIDRMGYRLTTIENGQAALQKFRDGFADDDGNLINGKTVIKRIVAIEKTIMAINVMKQMGKGAVMLGKFQLLVAGIILLIAIKGTMEGLEWLLTKVLAFLGLG